jgi:hypothetical protein
MLARRKGFAYVTKGRATAGTTLVISASAVCNEARPRQQDALRTEGEV